MFRLLAARAVLAPHPGAREKIGTASHLANSKSFRMFRMTVRAFPVLLKGIQHGHGLLHQK